MTTLHTGLPKHKGEIDLANQLIAFDDDKLHLWFALDFIPGVRDIDVLLWHESVGVFVIEVKAVSLEMIDSFGYNQCTIKDRDTRESPQQQAYSAYESLRRFISPQNTGSPFIVSTACWPKISREKWNEHWDDESVIGDFADRMIFSEDISDTDAFIRRLTHIWNNPPARKGASYSFNHDDQKFQKFKSSLQPVAHPKPTPSDIERLHAIEQKITRAIRKDVPAYSAKKICFEGHPGTGKTFRLLQIGVEHSCEKAQVLFVCFNKVLASDIRRLLCMSELLSMASEQDGKIDVFDVFDLANRYDVGYLEDEHSKDNSLDKHDRWVARIVCELEKKASQGNLIAQYDTILVDECQDMQDCYFRLIDLHANKKTTICMARGTGQELYHEANKSEWLKKFNKVATVQSLRRNFRNTKQVFEFATVFYEAALNLDKIPNKVHWVTKGNVGDEQVELLPRGGQLPQLISINDPEQSPPEDAPSFSMKQNEVMTAEYQRLIESEMESLLENENPIDLLLLVPSEKGCETEWARAALTKAGVNFVDYTKKSNRRDIAGVEQVRLCTFYSARGIEGTRVLILGLESIEHLVKQDTAINNLGYITLSRSRNETKIVMRNTVNNEVKKFLYAAIAEFRKVAGE